MTADDVQIIRWIAFDVTVALARTSLQSEYLSDEDEFYGTAELVMALARAVAAEPPKSGAQDAVDELVDLASDLMAHGEMVRYIDRHDSGTGLGPAGRTRVQFACKEQIAALRDAADTCRSSLAAYDTEQPSLEATQVVTEQIGVFAERVGGMRASIPQAVATRLQDRLKTREAEDNDDAEPLDDVLARLNALVGVEDVKREVATAISMYRVQQERIRRGLPAEGQSRHMVMLGPPGTGKTTVARLVAQAYRSLGSLRKGHIVECDRTDLVGEYLGQTGPKTNDKVDEALGGVLFIDEAYSLTLKQGDMYGDEAIAALLKRMEDDRDDLIVIVAGYADEMSTFLDSNPGLKSRFGSTLTFPSYDDADLRAIAERQIAGMGYTADPGVLDALGVQLSAAREADPGSFGNAREVRRLLEAATRRQAERLSRQDLSALPDDALNHLTEDDMNE